MVGGHQHLHKQSPPTDPKRNRRAFDIDHVAENIIAGCRLHVHGFRCEIGPMTAPTSAAPGSCPPPPPASFPRHFAQIINGGERSLALMVKHVSLRSNDGFAVPRSFSKQPGTTLAL